MPDSATIQARYAAGGSKAASNYRDAFQRGVSWQAAASSEQSEADWLAGVQEAASKKRRQAEIRKVSDSDFNAAALSKGAPVIGSRISAAAPKMATGYEPVRNALSSLNLPARTTDPDQNIDNRVKAVAHAARKAVGKE